ncbi:MAG: phosphoribosyltransferase domain-containing protein [Candidatus Melainabacteria bacterium]|nr:phosphoribosyltransferase domain-containing protein [Candidatus Melainabacteria bacterium]
MKTPIYETRRVELPTGVITVEVHDSFLPLDALCGFAARRNPKRGFLFVSKVLGKHMPVRPSLMLEVHEHLARQIPADLPGPVVMIGMAETATCLGQGVFEAFMRMSGREDLVFIHSTRYRVDRPAALEFLEEHSHAADHIMYLPEGKEACELFENARSLVLVDDEASTGKTVVNLAKAFKARIPSLSQVVTAVITDWRGPVRTEATHAAMPVPTQSIALLMGEYQFAAAAHLQHMEMPKVSGNNGLKDELLPRNHGRFGTTDALALAPHLVTQARQLAAEAAGQKVLVLGTGEFSFPPFHLAFCLEEMGVDVHFQTTTRSPVIAAAQSAIECGLTFADNYGDGIPNYLYNVSPAQYHQVLIAHETPADTIDPVLIRALGAQTVEL